MCSLCWSATRPRLSKIQYFRLICPWQCISCYPEKRNCCMSSGWTRRRWRQPWGGGILWSKTSSPPTSGGGRSPLKSAFWWVIYRRKILRKYIFLYKEQFLFNFVCLIWFWLHYVFAALSTMLPSILYTVSWKGKDFVCFLLSMEHHFCVKQNFFDCLVFLLSTERVLFCCLVFLLSTGRIFLSCVFAVDWKSFLLSCIFAVHWKSFLLSCVFAV